MKLGTLTFDTIEYASRANAVLGLRDSGKSYTATSFAEQLMECRDRPGGVPVTVFDPTGVWRYLRVPGKGKGYPVVVVGGVDGDLPLNPATIGKVIEGALIGGVSIVIDLTGDISKSTMRKVVTDSVNVMMTKNAKYGLRHVFLEEAAQFVPQNIGDPMVYEAVERMVRVGGNMGLGVTMVNPRTANLNKSVLELCDNLFLHRQKGTNSLKALREWFDANGLDEPKDLSKAVSRLKTAECFAWLRDFERPEHVHVQQKNSFHPNRRDLQASSGSSTKRVDAGAFIKTLRESLPAIEAEIKANDPKELRAEIAELKKQLAAKTPAAVSPKAKSKEEEQKLWSAAWNDGHNAGWAACMKQAARYKAAVTKDWTGCYQKILLGNAEWLLNVVLKRDLPTILREVALDVPKDLERNWGDAFGADAEALSVAASFKEPIKTETRPAPVSKTAPSLQSSGGGKPTGSAAERILKAIKWWSEHGNNQPTRVQVAFLAGYSPKSSGYEKQISNLTSAGEITFPAPGCLALTDLNAVAAPDLGTPYEAVRKVLDPRMWRVLVPLFNGETMSRDDLAAASNYSPASSGYEKTLSQMRSLSVIEFPAPKMVKAAGWLFGGQA